MILVDFSAITIGTFQSQGIAPEEGLLRHMILNNLRAINHKFRDEYGQMVLCCDAGSWRKEVFPNYKIYRQATRSDDQIDWAEVFEIFNLVEKEIRTFIPWKVIRAHMAEGDDVIGTLVERAQTVGTYEPVMIVASDGDYKQLHSDDVLQWSPFTKSPVTVENPSRWLLENVARGQSKDSIPNIYMDDDFFYRKLNEGSTERQKSVTKKKLDQIAEEGPGCLPTNERRNWDRNAMLMDLTKTPDEIKETILHKYDNYDLPPYSGVLNYLIQHRCSRLVDSVQHFKNKELDHAF